MNNITAQDDDLIIKSPAMIRAEKAELLKTDMQKFLDKFQPSKFKQMRGRVEIRSVNNLEEAQNKAREVINQYGLGLVVVRDAEMAANRTFEVREMVS
jgi:hypothetical protein